MSTNSGQNENLSTQNLEFLGEIGVIKNHFDKEISEIVDATGREFLSLGDKLKSYYYTSKELTNISKDGAINYSGKVIGELIENLKGLLKNVTNTLKEFDDSIYSQHKQLSDINFHIDGIISELAGTRKIVKYLRMLAISTKIENSRLSNRENDFNILAEDVEKLSIVINEKSKHLTATSTGLFNTIKATLFTTETIQKENEQQENDIFEDINNTLKLLTDKYDVCYTKINEINEISDKINKTTSEVVSSIQIQDIARQQLEHISDAAGEIENLLTAKNQSEQNKLENILAANKISRVQKAQLQNSESELTKAIYKIDGGLKVLKEEISSIYQTSLALGVGGDADENYIKSITEGLSEVQKELNINAGLRNEFHKSVKQIIETVIVLTNLIEDIEEVGSEIELISLNSRIKASQTGREGAALDVLAESIQGLSNDAKKLTDGIRSSINVINESAEALSKSHTSDEGKNDNTTDGLAEILNNLKEFEENSISLINQLTNNVSKLNEDSEYTVTLDSVKDILRENVSKMVEELEEIIENTSPYCDENQEQNADLENLKSKYTMDSERAIHNKLINGDSGTADESEDLGDNIELF